MTSSHAEYSFVLQDNVFLNILARKHREKKGEKKNKLIKFRMFLIAIIDLKR